MAKSTASASQALVDRGDGTAATPATAGIPYTAAVIPAVSALAFGATISVNAALANVFTVTLTSSAGTFAAPSNPASGQVIEFDITQGGSGSYTVAWASGAAGYDFGTTGAPTLSTSAGAIDAVAFRYNAAKGEWLCLGSALGF